MLENEDKWVLIRDADDGEMRVVQEKILYQYTKGTKYYGKWEAIAQDRPLEDLKACCRLAHGAGRERLVEGGWKYLDT